jgi:hypothetical protein
MTYYYYSFDPSAHLDPDEADAAQTQPLAADENNNPTVWLLILNKQPIGIKSTYELDMSSTSLDSSLEETEQQSFTTTSSETYKEEPPQTPTTLAPQKAIPNKLADTSPGDTQSYETIIKWMKYTQRK